MISKKLKKRMAEKKQAIKTGMGNSSFYYLNAGVTRIRPVPIPEDDDPLPEVITFFLGKELGTIISPKTFGERCPIMEKYEELSKSEKSSEIAGKFKPKKRFAMVALKYEDEKGKVLMQGGPRIVILPVTVGSQLIDFFTEDEDGYGDFTDAHSGYALKIKREGSGISTEYSVLATPPTPCPKPYNRERYVPTDEIRKVILPYDELKVKLDSFLAGNLPSMESSTEVKKKKKKNRDI